MSSRIHQQAQAIAKSLSKLLTFDTSSSELSCRPLIKWAGGKSKSADFITSFMPARIKTYYEPMVGGGAVFCMLANQGRFKSAVLGDTNEDLIALYSCMRLPHGIRQEFERRASYYKNSKAAFLKVRAAAPTIIVEQAARFLFLNKTCFNGLYRVNRKGQFNVPFAGYKNPTIIDFENWERHQIAQRSCSLHVGDYAESVGAAKKGDVVYFDPPYIPVSKTSSFTAYGSKEFDQAEHERLADTFAKLAKRGVTVLLSNSDTKLARNLYRGFKIHKTTAARSINSDGAKRGHVGEILVVANVK